MTDLPGQPVFEARPPAKVNLTLKVVGRRADGFHELRSIFLRIGLTDRLTMARASSSDRDLLTVSGLPGAPATRDNLVLRALATLRSHVGIDFPPLEVMLDKRIPAAAGLGGGSSDAASALKLAQAAWGIGLATAEESALGEDLGSDVPFFLSELTEALVVGRGEHVSPSSAVIGRAVLLVTPPIALRTFAVFDRFDQLDQPGASNGDPANDLWQAAASLEPSLPRLRTELEGRSGRPWSMSGSGPTLFALYPSVAEAAEAGRALAASRLPSLESALINAVDLVGPDPAWRYP
ncbi:MAG: hypothetical protein ABIP53_00495 [Candidatus Limnocylindrales bacterium]